MRIAALGTDDVREWPWQQGSNKNAVTPGRPKQPGPDARAEFKFCAPLYWLAAVTSYLLWTRQVTTPVCLVLCRLSSPVGMQEVLRVYCLISSQFIVLLLLQPAMMLHTRSKLLLRLAQATCGNHCEAALIGRSYALLVTQHISQTGTAGSGVLGESLHKMQQQQQHRQLLLATLALQAHSSSNGCKHLSSSANAGDSIDGGRQAGRTAAAAPARPRDMAIVFTCAKCDTRSVKAFTRQAYEHGLVLITCPGCQAMHLIADHLGWFGDSGFKIDEFMAAQGQPVKRVSIDSQHDGHSLMAGQQHQPTVTAEDLAGWSKVQQLLSSVAVAAHAGSATNKESHTGHSGLDQQDQHESQSSSSSSSSSSSTDASNSNSTHAGGASSCPRAETTAAATRIAAQTGVVDVSPADVEAWVRVQQVQQH